MSALKEAAKALREYLVQTAIPTLYPIPDSIWEPFDKAVDAPEWQPIETAPKDGTRVLIAFQSIGQWVILSAYWNTREDVWTDDAVVSFGYEETAEYEPTHWMPLPKPPEVGT